MSTRVEPFSKRTDPPVAGFLHTPESANGIGLVLTHGAGANCRSKLITSVAEAFCEAGTTVLRCDLPFRQQRPTGPPLRTADIDQQGIRRAVECLRAITERVAIGGHSYGGRMASLLAADDPSVASVLLLLSYPLHPPKRAEQMRTAHFPRLRTPALFVSGSRDGFGTTAELTAAIALIPARTQLLTIASAGHELLTKSNGSELPKLIVDTLFALGT